MALINKLNAIGDAIREKTGKEDLLTLDQMPDEIRSISGGAGGLNLNFKVEWYPTELDLPATAEENTIAVISDEDIANWIFSAEEPVAADGDVWFKVSDASDRPFNALPEEYGNSLYVYIQSAKQLAQGTWQDVISIKIFQEGEWREFSVWDGYYFKNGNQYADITGGWEVLSDYNGSVTTDIGETLKMDTPGAYPGFISTVNAVDLTNVSTIYFKSPDGKNGEYYASYVLICSEKEGWNSIVAQAQINTTGEFNGQIDVSGIEDGAYYIILRVNGGAQGGCYINISEIWGE